MTAAVNDGFNTSTRFAANIKSAHSLRSVELVGGKAHQINLEFFHIQRDLAGGLSGVDVEQDSAFTAHFTDFFDVLNDADFIVDGHHGNQGSIRTHGFGQSVEVQKSALADVHVCHFKAFAFKFSHGVQHGFVFGLYRD